MTGCGPERPSFLALNRAADWRRGFAWRLRTSDAGLELEPAVEHVRADAPPASAPLGFVDLTPGRCPGSAFLAAAATGALYDYDGGANRLERTAAPGLTLERPRAVAYLPGTLFVADPEAAAQRIVALEEGAWRVLWSATADHDGQGYPLGLGVPFLPIDLATNRRRGRLYALIPLDLPAPSSSQPAVVPAGARLAIAVFGPLGRLLRRIESAELTLAEATPVADIHLRFALAVAPDDSLFVLDRPRRRILHLTLAGAVAGSFPADRRPAPGDDDGERFRILPAGLAIDGDGTLYVGDGRRTLPAGAEDDRFVHRFAADGRYLGAVTGYRGAVVALGVDAGKRLLLVDPGTRREAGTHHLVVLLPRETLSTPEGPARGVFYSPPLDSREAGTRWHKLRLPGVELPGHAQVRVSYLVLDTEARRRQYEERLAEPTGDPQEKARLLDNAGWSEALINPRDALILSRPGRYLALRIELVAAGGDAPRVRSAEAWFPRISYLRYLPAVYQEDEAGRDFLERFLALFETLFDDIERTIDRLPRLFDPAATPSGFVRWLAAWLALAPDEAWPEERLRALLRRAPELYRRRGTRTGLQDLIELFTGRRPLIVEQFQLACAEHPELRSVLARLYGTDPYCFCVLLPPPRVRSEEERRAVQRLVDAERPAHTCAGVRLLEPLAQLDGHTYLEVNTYLNRPAPRLDSGAVLTRDSYLDAAAQRLSPAEQETEQGDERWPL